MRYANCKDSKIPWMGTIPSHWMLERAKWSFVLRNERGNDTPVLLAATQKNGMYPQDLIEGVVKVAEGTDVQQFRTVHKGDFVISLRSFQGGFERSDYEGVCSPAYQVFYANERWDSNYLKYLFKNELFIDAMNALTVGIREGRNIKYEDFANTILAIPPIAEQIAIADFLDTKIAHIDSVIAEAKASIEEYKAWKASIIYEAVTKGLDPNVEMKDSGVEWIGEIPSTLQVSRVGLHYEIILGKMLCPQPLTSAYSLEPYFCAANVHFSGIDNFLSKSMWFSPEEKVKYLVKHGDLLVVEGGAGAGGCAMYYALDENKNGIYVQNSIMIVRNKGMSDNRYLKFLLESLVGRGYVDCVCNKATIPHFTKEKLSAVPFPTFSPDEQIRISDFLEDKCNKIETLIAEKEKLISDLEAYKKSLIFEVVTGKRQVC